MNIAKMFKKHDADFLKFERIQEPAHRRPDLCAFLMLADAVEGKGDIIAAAEHDQISLDVDIEKFSAIATDDLIRDLVRCGVQYEADIDMLCMCV